MRLLSSLTFGAVVAAWVVTTAATAPQPAQSYDLAHEDTSDYTCWVEKATSQETAEGICGPRGKRPAGSLDVGAQVLVNGRPWVATITGLEPVGAN